MNYTSLIWHFCQFHQFSEGDFYHKNPVGTFQLGICLRGLIYVVGVNKTITHGELYCSHG